jgi:methylmalonyl-CoA/ethylmalonyl-CoA epimerase
MEGIGITGIGQLHVPTKDQARAIAFYRDMLGLSFLFEVPGMAFFQVGSIMLLLGPPTSPEFDHPATLIYYDVEDIHAAAAALTARGVAAIHAPGVAHREPTRELWLAPFRDSEGNPFELRQWKTM